MELLTEAETDEVAVSDALFVGVKDPEDEIDAELVIDDDELSDALDEVEADTEADVETVLDEEADSD